MPRSIKQLSPEELSAVLGFDRYAPAANNHPPLYSETVEYRRSLDPMSKFLPMLRLLGEDYEFLAKNGLSASEIRWQRKQHRSAYFQYWRGLNREINRVHSVRARGNLVPLAQIYKDKLRTSILLGKLAACWLLAGYRRRASLSVSLSCYEQIAAFCRPVCTIPVRA